MTKLQAMSKEKKVPVKLLGVRLEKHKVDDLQRLATRYGISLKALINTMVDEFMSKSLKNKKSNAKSLY